MYHKIKESLSEREQEIQLYKKILWEAAAMVDCQKIELYLFWNGLLDKKASIEREMETGQLAEPDFKEEPVYYEHIGRLCMKEARILECSPEGEGTTALAVPMLDINEIPVGAICFNQPRKPRVEDIIGREAEKKRLWSFASLAAVMIANLQYTGEIQESFHSFVRVISTAIDERTPFNARHTRSMVRYAMKLMNYCNEEYEKEKQGIYFSGNKKEQFLMSIWLHDIGKMVIPNHIMNKDTRLGKEREKDIEFRFEKMKLLNKISTLMEKQTVQQGEERDKELEKALNFICKINQDTSITEEERIYLLSLGKKVYEEDNGSQIPWLTREEVECLLIEKGTLTAPERLIMEGHAVFTDKLLSQIHFTREYCYVYQWAKAHHEYLDGSGYPLGLKGEEITKETRLITILDIFDALIAADRPYKEAMPVANALRILSEMAQQGKLDVNLVEIFKRSRCWK